MRGHSDIAPSVIPGQHIVDDLRNVLDFGWDMAVMFPPCTYLSYVGNRHWNAPGRACESALPGQAR